jgi:HD-GYP domain-containing protein (c-di-GMP phosphodiesterase class II)
MVATFDGQQVNVMATTGAKSDDLRFAEIREHCAEAVKSGALPEKIRQDGIVIPLSVGAKPVGFVYVEPTRELSSADIDLLKVMAQQCSSALENLRLHLDLQGAYDHAIDMLADIAEFKDKTTGQHIRRIDNYSRMVAIELGVPAVEAELFGKASRLHDVGKIGIPDDILRKRGKLTEAEFEIMKTHVTIGASVLSHDPSLAIAREVALSHHERWVGGGYPSGQPSSQVSLLTRIVSVVDVFDALISRRPYKEAWTIDAAATTIEAAAGSQFDPAVVTAFLKLLRRGDFDEVMASVQADNHACIEH